MNKKERRLPVDRLLRGIASDHVETVRDAWRDLLKDGEASVPQILDKLESSAWAENPRGPLSGYLCVLLLILDELNKSAFEKEVARLQRSKLHPLHAKTLEVLSQRIVEEPVAYVANGVPVFVTFDIADHSLVVRSIDIWSQTRGLSLENVTRIDVIARHPDLEYLGKYNLFFSGIILTWPADAARGVKCWWRLFQGEFTFYHEVGHHVSGHIEGGQVTKQEKEADAYARSIMRNSRPVLMWLGRTLLWPCARMLPSCPSAPPHRP